jgi:hypothetical protein
MKLFNRVVIGLAFAVTAWPAHAADFYWSCTTPVGSRYADATRCDVGDVGVKVMKDGAASADGFAYTNPLAVCPQNPAVCKLPDFDVKEGTPRTQAITRFMRQKECEFLQRFPKRCERPN